MKLACMSISMYVRDPHRYFTPAVFIKHAIAEPCFRRGFRAGVFDSIVFCATSAVALCLVSALWFVRHCAPFPKEALLPLRDPPSVRYTAIPDHTLA